MKSTPSRRKRRPYHPSGLYGAQRALEAYGRQAVPPAGTPVGDELDAWRSALVADLGGSPSTAQLAIVDLVTRLRFLIAGVDGYLLTLPSVVDKRHRKLWPVVEQRQRLAGDLVRHLAALGLERRSRPVADLTSYLQEQGSGLPPRAPAQPCNRDDDGGAA